ncbi:uncharacterized protein HMPREF1541_03124 [Cyphellophora europaea CBS 101466]|uniref:Uncharacterized protein n=1 Tax=Cyphellophora europaea (strain CBS 101466) TaxID=1220924 RepID=W2RZR9_CYPE1|nr:uncharacterized protein HMPREF1541_03124 [Cyphellophora europaea CBS 101466]ETN41189.1 hypothetical protein HMPREF1541_03124 [Cyphellophora europaea CBS 101466]
MAAMIFEFVNDSSPRSHKDRDPVERHLIRKKAMRAAATTKKRQAVSRSHNSSLPVSDSVTWTPIFFIHPQADATQYLPSSAVQKTIFAALKGKLNAPYVKLSKLLRLCTPQLVDLLRESGGRVPYLDHAIDCLKARIRERVGTTPTEGDPMALYGRAIFSLQQALDTSDMATTETWLATICLTLFELLDIAGNPAWMMHAKGAFSVLQHIGPDNLVTESHKIMLAASACAIATETLHNGLPCMLDQPPWQAAVRRTMVPNTSTFHPRGEMVNSAQLLRYKIPSIFADITNIIMRCERHGFEAVMTRTSDLCDAYKAFLEERHERLRQPVAPEVEPYRLLTLEMTLSCAALSMRLLSSILPQRFELETSALLLAREALENSPPDQSSERVYHRGVASSVVITSEIWQDSLKSSPAGATVIESEPFRQWCNALGRPA